MLFGRASQKCVRTPESDGEKKGETMQNQERTNQNKKKSIIITVVSICLVVAVVCGLSLIHISKGKKQLQEKREEWDSFTSAVNQVLNGGVFVAGV